MIYIKKNSYKFVDIGVVLIYKHMFLLINLVNKLRSNAIACILCSIYNMLKTSLMFIQKLFKSYFLK
jgi:hypothetical protein